MALAELASLGSAAGFARFAQQLYRTEKFGELGAFAAWEARYQLRLFGAGGVLSLRTNLRSQVGTLDIPEPAPGLGVVVRRCPTQWNLSFTAGDGRTWGSVGSARHLLCVQERDGGTRGVCALPDNITGIFVSSQGRVLVSAAGGLYRVDEARGTAKCVLRFSHPVAAFRTDAITETAAGDLWIGEYANVRDSWRGYRFAGLLHRSVDGGKTWRSCDFLRRQGVNKHVHLLRWSRLLDGLVMTDGDNQKNLWLNRSRHVFDRVAATPEQGWCRISGSLRNRGGHTAFCEIPGRLFFGTDHHGGTNFVVDTRDMRRFRWRAVPSPYRRAIFERIMARKGPSGLELWATTMFTHSASVRSAVMRSADRGQTWTVVYEFDGRTTELNLIGQSHGILPTLQLLARDRRTAASATYEICSA